jgi:hypothetical protein
MASWLVGSRAKDLASDLDSPTVWGALSAINLKIEEVRTGANNWLLGLEPATMVSTLHFPGTRNARDLRRLSFISDKPSPLITKAITHLGISKVKFDSLGTSNQDVRLVSGLLDFLYKFGAAAPLGIKALLLVDKSWRAGHLPKRKRSVIKWIRQDHSKFGGATDYCYLFGVIGLELDPTLSNLARSIGHVF